MEVVKIAQCLLTINIKRLICPVIKMHVVKEAIHSSSSFNTFHHITSSLLYRCFPGAKFCSAFAVHEM